MKSKRFIFEAACVDLRKMPLTELFYLKNAVKAMKNGLSNNTRRKNYNLFRNSKEPRQIASVRGC